MIEWIQSLVATCFPPRRAPVAAAGESESGQGLVEYALVATLCSIVAVVVATSIGADLPNLFQGALNAL